MNQFVVLACLAVIGGSLAAPRPDVSHLGYRYQAGGYNGNLPSSVVSTPLVVGTSYQPTAAGSNYFSSAPSIGQLNSGSVSTGFVPSSSSTSSSAIGYQVGGAESSSVTVGDSIGLQGLQPGPTINYNEQESYISHLANFQPAQVSKHFYIHSAPEDHDEQQIVRYVNVGRPQKNYRVVFINAPTSTTSKAKIIANVAPVEERPPSTCSNYDALGGASETSNEGIIPVSSVIGSLGDNGASGVVTDASGSLNIVGTGGVPNADVSYNNVGFDAEGSQRQVISTFNGSNAQATYLPARPVRK
ncbi:GL26860 [Drosophila persimilis]|uniref:GL26860 n=1 Tax=Drosophila persimilis TaxID=7234 RepID=B4H2L4_DROPE|nr:GL26860 [Drosophila persimilis]